MVGPELAGRGHLRHCMNETLKRDIHGCGVSIYFSPIDKSFLISC